jgi:adenylyltransferase/sulfurtransferase
LEGFDFGKLSNDEIERYSRQLLFQKFGVQGQLLVRATKVLVVGAGGLGSGILPVIAGAGFGAILLLFVIYAF